MAKVGQALSHGHFVISFRPGLILFGGLHGACALFCLEGGGRGVGEGQVDPPPNCALLHVLVASIGLVRPRTARHESAISVSDQTVAITYQLHACGLGGGGAPTRCDNAARCPKVGLLRNTNWVTLVGRTESARVRHRLDFHSCCGDIWWLATSARCGFIVANSVCAGRSVRRLPHQCLANYCLSQARQPSFGCGR